MTHHPVTPDGRYFVVRGRLWRMADPALRGEERQRLVGELMAARRAVRDARGDPAATAAARARVDAAKRALGERGPVWWTDGAPDLNRRMVHMTGYAAWFEELSRQSPSAAPAPPAPRSAGRAGCRTRRSAPGRAAG